MIAICRWFCSPEGVINSSHGNYESILAWVNPFKAVGELMRCVQSRELDARARAPGLRTFILLGSFIDTLLVLLILDIVYDCHL